REGFEDASRGVMAPLAAYSPHRRQSSLVWGLGSALHHAKRSLARGDRSGKALAARASGRPLTNQGHLSPSREGRETTLPRIVPWGPRSPSRRWALSAGLSCRRTCR